MNDNTNNVVRGRWTRGHRAAHDHETITLAERADGTWEVRRTGRCGGLTTWPNRASAEAAIARAVGDAWVAVPVRQPERWKPRRTAPAA